MTANTITWDSVRDEILADPKLKAEYDAISPEFKLARAVITLRENIGLTQREFAAKVGMKQSQLARIESGKQTPKLKTLAKLAAAAGYEVEVNLIPIDSKQKGDTKPLHLTPNELVNS
ncbi:MAG: helix-turn-helix transcriptional regulator [Xenococcaceae cyanobacterium MO_207.B15]|nr:helix-turn-helix transcriptional regulator [Xenococcaceae cyanobacterium MO_207.B15]